MTETSPIDWNADNQACLIAAMDILYDMLNAHDQCETPISDWPSWPLLDDLADRFALDPFAAQVLLLAAATELDGRIAHQIGELNEGAAGGPSVATLFRLCAEAHWAALSPQAELRRMRLITTDESDIFTNSRLRLPERVLHFLLGVPAIDVRLEPYIRPIQPSGTLAPVHEDLANGLSQWLETVTQVQLTGADHGTRRGVAMLAASNSGRPVLMLSHADVPLETAEREAFAKLWTREAIMTGALLMLDLSSNSPEAIGPIAALADKLPQGLILSTQEPLPAHLFETTQVHLPALDLSARRDLWRRMLVGTGVVPETETSSLSDRLAGQFQLSVDGVRASVRSTIATVPSGEYEGNDLWQAARAQSRPGIAGLAERIETQVDWVDLILPSLQMETLREIEQHAMGRSRVYEDWGFRAKLSARGMGITALFAGPSGTGKTLAAEVLSNALQLDLYRIDLASVISKYIGETEKNLGRIFDAAEIAGAILLFDEADALFGKRSEVKDSHDRYANIEVSYLLQRMESYSGLAILTTNLKGNLDSSFLRRLRFVIDFPFPSAEQRREIWRRTFPLDTPLGDVNFAHLAQLNMPGGVVRNIALNAAFRAAARGDQIEMRDLLQAARGEYAKLEKPLTGSEIRGWEVSS